MKEQDVVRLKRPVSSSGKTHPVGTTVTITSIDEATHSFDAEIAEAEGTARAVIRLSKEDVLPPGDVEIYHSNPLTLLSITPVERLNKDVRVELHVVIANPNGATFVSSSSTWMLFDDIMAFVNEMAALQAKESNSAKISSATADEFAFSVWQRHGLPIVTLSVARHREIQNQLHNDTLVSAFELETPIQTLIDGFRKLAVGNAIFSAQR